VQQALAPRFTVEVAAMKGQIGSGSLPVETLASSGFAVAVPARKGSGRRAGGASPPRCARCRVRWSAASPTPPLARPARPGGRGGRAQAFVAHARAAGAPGMIIGTAGHIDHGKTTLVKALTGVDTDRLPEEKKRGISIELGYAFLDAPEGARIGFIDVPGHERLVHTMLAGASGIDHALLLVAADDGVMPQTREHLAVLALLGVPGATVVVTKADRADAGARAGRGGRRRRRCSPPPASLARRVHAVSAATGQGVPALRERLFEVARGPAPPRAGAAGLPAGGGPCLHRGGHGHGGHRHGARRRGGRRRRARARARCGRAAAHPRARGACEQPRRGARRSGRALRAARWRASAREIRRGQWLVAPAAGAGHGAAGCAARAVVGRGASAARGHARARARGRRGDARQRGAAG
jgi:small GTP-binding protein